jgi:hypothetical protein
VIIFIKTGSGQTGGKAALTVWAFSFFIAQELLAVKQAAVRETPLFAPFIYENDHFTKTGSGQT